jgi:pyruvate-ferredoxin/flavodoxin oxidoreductase
VLQEADEFPGPSLVIAYSHCISHGYDLSCGLDHQKFAVESGYWPLYRFDPRHNPAFKLDSAKITRPVQDFLDIETRFKALKISNPEKAAAYAAALQEWVTARFARYQNMAECAKLDMTDEPTKA